MTYQGIAAGASQDIVGSVIAVPVSQSDGACLDAAGQGAFGSANAAASSTAVAQATAQAIATAVAQATNS